VDIGKVLRAHFELELAESLNEWHPLNVPDSATKL
jgi:hypothetical protein